jgi:hypothetical protein
VYARGGAKASNTDDPALPLWAMMMVMMVMICLTYLTVSGWHTAASQLTASLPGVQSNQELLLSMGGCFCIGMSILVPA